MHLRFLVLTILALLATGLPLARAQDQATVAVNKAATNIGPRIEFAESTHDFGRLQSGKAALWNFAFTNSGSETLVINDVKASCGCTTLGEPTRRVEPGKSGIIPIEFNSGGMAGQIIKNIFLTCNDPAQSNVVLYFTATVWKPIDAIPVIASFFFGPDFQTNQTRSIRLTSNLDEPVTLSAPVCTNDHFRAELKTLKEGREFELLVTVLPPLGPGSWLTPVTMKTSSPKMPEVKVDAYAIVRPALSLMPPQIMLPPAPLTDASQYSVAIQNQTTNAVALSEPSLNLQGAQVHLQELQPGRLFQLTATFPAGVKISPGQHVELRVKSNHPQMPLLSVPISQAQPADDSAEPVTSPAPAINSEKGQP